MQISAPEIEKTGKSCYTGKGISTERMVDAMAKDGAARLRLRPVGAADRKKLPEYGPLGTGCPAIERAVAALYKGQNEESFWALMNAINYALELDTRAPGAAGSGVRPAGRGRPVGGASCPGGESEGPAALDPAHPEGPVLPAGVHLREDGRGRQRHGQPPHGGTASGFRHADGAGTRTASTAWSSTRGPALPRWTARF